MLSLCMRCLMLLEGTQQMCFFGNWIKKNFTLPILSQTNFFEKINADTIARVGNDTVREYFPNFNCENLKVLVSDGAPYIIKARKTWRFCMWMCRGMVPVMTLRPAVGVGFLPLDSQTKVNWGFFKPGLDETPQFAKPGFKFCPTHIHKHFSKLV